MKNYKQLSFKERTIIEYLYKLNKSITYIVKELGRNKSTISQELKQILATPLYIAKDAQFTTGMNIQNKTISKQKSLQNFLILYMPILSQSLMELMSVFLKLNNWEIKPQQLKWFTIGFIQK
ncbi:transposase [Entomoplasma ellychniae]|uniref:Transposase n=1 Tax=Entomoplasma ellychniae TaxID=2114 RepID=A0A8E2QYB1_9MOLU|nr:helix-turn-helix domain-containing protein [Entomoplasma ellychniae]PPE05098.1 transposase [Entomoplasma ellychniae]